MSTYLKIIALYPVNMLTFAPQFDLFKFVVLQKIILCLVFCLMILFSDRLKAAVLVFHSGLTYSPKP